MSGSRFHAGSSASVDGPRRPTVAVEASCPGRRLRRCGIRVVAEWAKSQAAKGLAREDRCRSGCLESATLCSGRAPHVDREGQLTVSWINHRV